MKPLEIEFETESKSLFGYVEGKEFNMKMKIKNPSGGFVYDPNISIQIRWPNGQIVNKPVFVGKLDPKQEKSFTIITDALCGGYPLFYARGSVGHKEGQHRDQALLYQMKSGQKIELKDNVSFHSFFVRTREAFYSFWALIFAVVSSMIAAIGLVLTAIL